jgi:hypothetical protein
VIAGAPSVGPGCAVSAAGTATAASSKGSVDFPIRLLMILIL